MSSDRNAHKPFKPVLAPTSTLRPARAPLTPRIAGNASAAPTRPATAPRLPTTRTPIVSPRVKPQDGTPAKDTPGTLNVTPRSTTRKTRVESANSSPGQDDPPLESRPKSGFVEGWSGRTSAASGLSIGGGSNAQSIPRAGRPKSIVSDRTPNSPPLIRSSGFVDLGVQSSGNDSIDSRFFHASDMPKQEPAPKRPEPKKTPSFFYADGKQDRPSVLSSKASSPVLSAVSDKRSSRPKIPDAIPSKSPPLVSPALSTTSAATPFFTSALSSHGQLRSPSPSKESIHLSYRKGASQIFGLRPAPSPTTPSSQGSTHPAIEESRRPVRALSHRKSSSLSSIDSGLSQSQRRRSGTAVDTETPSSPLAQGSKSATYPLVAAMPAALPTIDTSLASPGFVASPAPFSPTKNSSELAADARRERKVLDLEISNSSLLAINTSLEREVRRQKAELKRFRRLSRAGRFSAVAAELPRKASSNLDTLDEDDEDEEFNPFDAMDEDQDDLSESEEDGSSVFSGGESLSPDARASREQDRLAKDEKRLRVDLEKHKELLVQSQAMNQSIKRCMYATEEMIREGKKSLEYHVRVSDVKLGGRILSGHDDDEIEVDDSWTEAGGDGMDSAKGLLDVWSGVGRRTLEGSEGSGDRDSGIEVDKPPGSISARPGLSILSNSEDIMAMTPGSPGVEENTRSLLGRTMMPGSNS